MKSIAWAVGIGLPVCGGAIGYACGDTNGAVYGVAAGLAVSGFDSGKTRCKSPSRKCT